MIEKLNKYINNEQHLSEYNRIVKENETQIRDVVDTIRKIDSSTFYKKASASTSDLDFKILVDNPSGMRLSQIVDDKKEEE